MGALVEAAFAEHDKDGNGTIEQEEFVAFAQQNVRTLFCHEPWRLLLAADMRCVCGCRCSCGRGSAT